MKIEVDNLWKKKNKKRRSWRKMRTKSDEIIRQKFEGDIKQ